MRSASAEAFLGPLRIRLEALKRILRIVSNERGRQAREPLKGHLRSVNDVEDDRLEQHLKAQDDGKEGKGHGPGRLNGVRPDPDRKTGDSEGEAAG